MTESYLEKTIAYHLSREYGGWVAFIDGKLMYNKLGHVCTAKNLHTLRQSTHRQLRGLQDQLPKK